MIEARDEQTYERTKVLENETTKRRPPEGGGDFVEGGQTKGRVGEGKVGWVEKRAGYDTRGASEIKLEERKGGSDDARRGGEGKSEEKSERKEGRC